MPPHWWVPGLALPPRERGFRVGCPEPPLPTSLGDAPPAVRTGPPPLRGSAHAPGGTFPLSGIKYSWRRRGVQRKALTEQV